MSCWRPLKCRLSAAKTTRPITIIAAITPNPIFFAIFLLLSVLIYFVSGIDPSFLA
jgi:hypothetical protein